jgi:hypothetical protein
MIRLNRSIMEFLLRLRELELREGPELGSAGHIAPPLPRETPP